MNKNRIILSFSRSAFYYEKNADIQKQTALDLSNFAKNIDGLGIDLGCGTGFLSDILKKNIIGVDISKNMIEIYKQKNNLATVCDIENLPFKDNSFDFAISNFSLHWTDLNKSIREIHRVLKKDSKLYFCMPVEGSLNIVKKVLGYDNFNFLDEYSVLEITRKYLKIENYFSKDYIKTFNSGIEFLNHLHYTGSAIGKEGLTFGEKKRIYEKFKGLKGNIKLNFKVMFVRGKK